MLILLLTCKSFSSLLAMNNLYNIYIFKMDNFEKCLEDIEAALQFGYPDNMRFKLLDRQENIFNTDHEL